MAKFVGSLTIGIIASAVFLLALSSLSHAQGTFEQRRACRQDALKFCRDEVPDVPRITACMMKNLKSLSPLCRAQFR
jgi:hypothetical protein